MAAGLTEAAGTALAIVKAVRRTSTPNTQLNATVSIAGAQDWSDTLSGPCEDLDADLLVPIIPEKACTNVLGRVSVDHSLSEERKNTTQVTPSIDCFSGFVLFFLFDQRYTQIFYQSSLGGIQVVDSNGTAHTEGRFFVNETTWLSLYFLISSIVLSLCDFFSIQKAEVLDINFWGEMLCVF